MVQSGKDKEPGAWRRLQRMVVVALTLVSLAALGLVTGLYYSQSLLTIEDQPTQADVLVVLGGEAGFRPKRALELFTLHLAPNILVSGSGDGDGIKSWLLSKDVPDSAIHVESKSVNTMQNAEFAVAMLRVQNVRRVILVTSWFHSRRALACFQKAAPELEFISVPTVADRPRAHWPNQYERRMVLNEYLKLAGYWVRYGVCPI